MSNGWNIALLGATGAVGTALLELLQEREFPVGELYALASENGAARACVLAAVRCGWKTPRISTGRRYNWLFSWPVWKPAPAMPKRRATPVVW